MEREVEKVSEEGKWKGGVEMRKGAGEWIGGVG